MERRKFTRIPFASHSMVRYRGTVIEGEVQNVSLNGLLLKTSHTPGVGEDVFVRLWVPHGDSELRLDFTAVIVRHVSGGMAVRFTGMCLESYGELLNIISRNLNDHQKVFGEFFSHLTREYAQRCFDKCGNQTSGTLYL